ncbi:chromosome segregation protein SMC [Candidatus Woesearchaeota archaeon CG_4_10_14_0_2_um_filter_33_13]|nr:MAG: chromosome segregation protein SMC [Candidatus Woesearchaeota archaeon CG_4_10_14_0_2_um_filter_33_13]
MVQIPAAPLFSINCNVNIYLIGLLQNSNIYKSKIKRFTCKRECFIMTKINRIQIHGFKSFAQKTDVPLDNKFNCIIGPNGSGKSNVGDAICFVLGRLSAKSMRVEKASHLIFNGGKKKTPATSASVEIAFCNKNKVFPVEDSEIIVNRSITKTGNSVYRINGKKKTRGEVLDLLSAARINPDGYNIILQGDIMRFVDMSPMERRKIIEEISDVSIYEEKKHKAMLELNKVEEKLNNAVIILQERKTYLKELKKDRDQALKFKELKEQIDSYKATNLHLQIKEREEVKGKFDQEIEKHQTKIKKAEEKISELKKQVESGKDKVAKFNQEIEQKGEKEQLELHRDVEDLKVELAKDKTRISTLKDELNKIEQRKDQLGEELKELEEKAVSFSGKGKDLNKRIQEKKNELETLIKNIADFKKKNKIESSQEMEDEIENKDKLIETQQEEAQKIRQEQQELLREKDRIEYQLETIDERIKKVKEVESENKSQIKDLQQKKTEFKNSTLRLNQCIDQDSSFASQLSNAKSKLMELQEKQAQLNAKAMSVQAALSGNKAVESILSNKKKFGGIHGTISELGQANRQYSLPLEMAAGARMQNIVVDDDKIAAECIKYLKNNKLGSASFIPLNKIRYQEISNEDQKLAKQSGVHDFALNLIKFRSEYKKAFAYVFGNTLIVEDIDTARKVGVSRIKMATLDGALTEASGVMRGGFLAKKQALGFKEQDSIEELERIEAKIAESESVISSILTRREANEKEISFLRNKRSELEAEVIKLEKTLHLDDSDLTASEGLKKELKEKLKEVEIKSNEIQNKISVFNHELATLKSAKQNLRSQVSELRNPRLLAQLSAYEESRQKAKEDLVRLENDLKNSSLQVDQIILPEKQKIQDIFKQHDKEEQEFKAEIKQLSEKITIKDKELVKKEAESKEFYSKYKELFNQREKETTLINKAENEIENVREDVRGSERESNLISLKNAEVKAKLAGLYEDFEKYKEITIISGKTVQELQHEINKFEVMLSQMSAVNMKALEIYEEIEREYTKLVEKKDSLDQEKTDVLTLMNEIETKKKDHFMKTFDQANDNFQRIFSNLFKKGNAYLELDNKENLFEGGLSIKVKLTGNRYMDIKSLSGGEKTLTALSFIFAIQEYQPATFYILDEIDAALDKHNSETLSKLIRDYSDKAQYIVISHNDALMSEADTLFGVSMNEHGISKVTSLRI